MNEKTLRNFSIAASILGLIMLFIVSQNLQIRNREISSITPSDVGTTVRVCGDITEKTSSKGGHIFITLRDDTAEIKTVIFNNTAQIIAKTIDVYSLKKHDAICMSGEVNLYKGELEIIGEKIAFAENVL